MENDPKDYGLYFKERFGRTATKEDLSHLLDRLFNNLSATENALVPVKQDNPLSYLVQGIQETSPEITIEKIDEALSAMYEEEQKVNHDSGVKAQKEWRMYGKFRGWATAGLLTIGSLLVTVAPTCVFYHYKLEEDKASLESLTKMEASSTIPKEILDAYAEHHNILEERVEWARPYHDKTIFDETINGVHIVAKTFLAGRIMGRFHGTIDDFLVLYQYGSAGLASMHFYDGSFNNDADEIVDDAEPFCSIFFNRDDGGRKGKRVIEANFYDEIFQEHDYYGKEDRDGDGWGGVTYYGSAIPEGKMEPYHDLSERFLEEFQKLYKEYSWKRFIVKNPH